MANVLLKIKLAFANPSINGAMIMAMPFISLFITGGITLLVTLLIETIVIKNNLGLNVTKATKLSFELNLYSMLINAGIVLAYSSYPAFLICWIPGTIIIHQCFQRLCRNTRSLPTLVRKKIITFLIFFLFGLIGFAVGTALDPSWMEPGHQRIINPTIFPDPLVSFFYISILAVIGFIITCIIEGFIFTQYAAYKSDNIISTVLSMNLFSYTAVAVIYFLLRLN